MVLEIFQGISMFKLRCSEREQRIDPVWGQGSTGGRGKDIRV
jgi:hypothetical protein